MIDAIEQFRKNIASIRELGSLYTLIQTQYPILTPNLEEILRSQIVLTVSALDCFIHDCVRIGMLEIYKGTRTNNDSFEKYSINLKTLNYINSATTQYAKLIFLEKYIRERNSRDSYQSPKTIEYALSILNIRTLWSQLAAPMGMTAQDIKNELSLIVDRRNKIAHEADLNPLLGTKYPISITEINSVTTFIELLCEKIYEIII